MSLEGEQIPPQTTGREEKPTERSSWHSRQADRIAVDLHQASACRRREASHAAREVESVVYSIVLQISPSIDTAYALLILLVGRAGFEPATNGLKVRCSTN